MTDRAAVKASAAVSPRIRGISSAMDVRKIISTISSVPSLERSECSRGSHTPTPGPLRGRLRHLFETSSFGYFTCILVVVDSLIIGLEQTWRLERADTTPLRALETGLVTYYMLELLAVFYAQGNKQAIKSRWVRLDCFLVSAGIAAQILMRSGMDRVMGDAALVLRLVRMLRLARTYRILVQFHDLWMFAHGLVNFTRIMMHTLVPGVIVLYIFSCVAMELIPLRTLEGSDDVSEELLSSLHLNFRSLPVTMLTLLQFVTLDSASGVYRPWVEASPSLAVFFVGCILLLGIVFMNLVTAVIVNDALEGLAHDHEMQAANAERKRNHMLHSLERAFQIADVDSSGDLSRDELICISQHYKEMLHDLLGSHDLVKLFDYLDVDGDERLCTEEFCAGIESLVQSDTRLEIRRVERVLESLRRQLQPLTRAARQGSIMSLPEKLSTPPVFQSEERPVAPLVTTPLKATEVAMPAWAEDILGSLSELSLKLDRALDRALLSCADVAVPLQAQVSPCPAARDKPPEEEQDGGCSECWSKGSEWLEAEEEGSSLASFPLDVPESARPVLWSRGPTGGPVLCPRPPLAPYAMFRGTASVVRKHNCKNS